MLKIVKNKTKDSMSKEMFLHDLSSVLNKKGIKLTNKEEIELLVSYSNFDTDTMYQKFLEIIDKKI